MFDDEKPYDGRLSRTVLRELQPEMPVSTRLIYCFDFTGSNPVIPTDTPL